MTPKTLISLVVVFLLVLTGLDSFFIVKETEKAVLKRFSQIVETDIKPGIYWKIPFIDNVIRVDGRTLVHDVPSQPFLTSEKKLLQVDSFVVWRIADVQKYITAVGSAGNASPEQVQYYAQQLLDPRVKEGLRNQIADRTVQQVVAGQREKLMDKVTQEVNKKTLADLGIQVIDIRVKQTDWPEQVRGRVFDRMRAERKQDAARYRAEGKEEAEKIRAEADRKKSVILAQAYRDAQEMRGEGDAKAARIYADAYRKDPGFFRFYRSLKAYRHSFNKPSDVLVLQPDSEFFKYMKNSGTAP